ncbi:hypothetical protein TREAZ_2164 [Leadbettera azotonutricia ZAS-9]|uniref:Uncharacterized protein n=1 Tax=Leadbettera azotonutricia (strain ATCC BAA-888 / DSM 13862 / ZAS-9) TaxID=545695 RepID=F5Y998_LEAAZ|nr:hypothetical protein TREAZ_2164 [Leadbettera azotonutricia ZAS-9]
MFVFSPIPFNDLNFSIVVPMSKISFMVLAALPFFYSVKMLSAGFSGSFLLFPYDIRI